MVNSPLIRPYLFLGGGSFGGGSLDSHENRSFQTFSIEKSLISGED